MSARHTPGPWNLETVPTSCGSCHKIGPFPGSGSRPQVHACVYADGIRIGIDDKAPAAHELLANARLIAAAPDLLEALKTLLADTQHRDHNCGDEDWCPVIAARKAIAKAMGEQP